MFGWFKPKKKYSLEHLNHLYQQLVKNPVVNEQNKGLIIETLRQIAELMIWGDQHNPQFFDFFLEKNILEYFLTFLDQKVSKTIKIQLLQTLSIFIENIKNKSCIYYLFSNNHINGLIVHDFDFSDDELLAYYISFVKTISLKLDRSTIQFFFNEQQHDFPLYTEAVKFFRHEESMIRIAVRTLTLNIYRVEDEAMRRFILDESTAPYFNNLVWFIRSQVSSIEELVGKTTFASRGTLENAVLELADNFYYLHDIFDLDIGELNSRLTDRLLEYFVVPCLALSLDVSNGWTSESSPESDVGLGAPEYAISPLLALFTLTQLFHVFSSDVLVNEIAGMLLDKQKVDFLSYQEPSIEERERSLSHCILSFKNRGRRFSGPNGADEDAMPSSPRMIDRARLVLSSVVKKRNDEGKDLVGVLGPLPGVVEKEGLADDNVDVPDVADGADENRGKENRYGMRRFSESSGVVEEDLAKRAREFVKSGIFQPLTLTSEPAWAEEKDEDVDGYRSGTERVDECPGSEPPPAEEGSGDRDRSSGPSSTNRHSEEKRPSPLVAKPRATFAAVLGFSVPDYNPVPDVFLANLRSSDDRCVFAACGVLYAIWRNKRVDRSLFCGFGPPMHVSLGPPPSPPAAAEVPENLDHEHESDSDEVDSLTLFSERPPMSRATSRGHSISSMSDMDDHCSSYPREILDLLLPLLVRLPRPVIVTLKLIVNLVVEFSDHKVLCSSHVKALCVAYRTACRCLLERLERGFSRQLFVELFEDQAIKMGPLHFSRRVTNTLVLVPPSDLPVLPDLSDPDAEWRLPIGQSEETVRDIQIFLLLHSAIQYLELSHNALVVRTGTSDGLVFPCLTDLNVLSSEVQTSYFPIPAKVQRKPRKRLSPFVEKKKAISEFDVINLAGKELFHCNVIAVNQKLLQRYLVCDLDRGCVIVVKPDPSRAGWAIVRFAAPLKEVNIWIDEQDARILHMKYVASFTAEQMRERQERQQRRHANVNVQSTPPRPSELADSPPMQHPNRPPNPPPHIPGRSSSGKSTQKELSIRLIFSDRVRCFSAREAVVKGKSISMDHKLEICIQLLKFDDYGFQLDDAAVKSCRESEASLSSAIVGVQTPSNRDLPLVHDAASVRTDMSVAVPALPPGRRTTPTSSQSASPKHPMS